MAGPKTSLNTNQRWNLVYTAHGNEFIETTPVDNYYDDRPFLRYMRGTSITVTGGDRLIVPINHGGDNTTEAIGKTDTFTFTDTDPITAAEYDWAKYIEKVIIHEDDEFRAGPSMAARLNLVQIKMQDAIQRMMDRISEDLLKDGSRTNNKHVHTLTEAIPVDPTVTGSTFGRIDPSSASWWQSKTDTSVTFSTGGLDAMRSMVNNVSAGGKKRPSLILTDQVVHEDYEDLAEGRHSIDTGAQSGAGRVADLGFGGGSLYKGIPVMWDADFPNLGSGQRKMFFLNNDAIGLVEAPKPFTFSGFESAVANGKDAKVGIIRWRGQLVVKNRRCLGQISTITASS